MRGVRYSALIGDLEILVENGSVIRRGKPHGRGENKQRYVLADRERAG